MSDPTSSSRKHDHIELAFKSQLAADANDERFYYEPMLGFHLQDIKLSRSFLGKQLQMPLWISSMTGGTELAGTITRGTLGIAMACVLLSLLMMIVGQEKICTMVPKRHKRMSTCGGVVGTDEPMQMVAFFVPIFPIREKSKFKTMDVQSQLSQTVHFIYLRN